MCANSGLLWLKPEGIETCIFLQRLNGILQGFQFFRRLCSSSIFMISKSFKGNLGDNQIKTVLRKCWWCPSLHLLSIYTKRLKFLSVKFVIIRSSSYSFKQKQLPSGLWLTVFWWRKRWSQIPRYRFRHDELFEKWGECPFLFYFLITEVKGVYAFIYEFKNFPNYLKLHVSSTQLSMKKEVS